MKQLITVMSTGKIMSENCFLIMSAMQLENVVLKAGKKKLREL